MIYRIISTMDAAIEVEAPDDTIAAVAAHILGDGTLTVVDDRGAVVMPFFLWVIGNTIQKSLDPAEWFSEHGIDDLPDWTLDHLCELSSCLRSARSAEYCPTHLEDRARELASDVLEIGRRAGKECYDHCGL